MRYLLDTNVFSEIRKGQRADPKVGAWFESVDDDALCLSVLVIGEIRTGIERRRRKDPKTALALETWLVGIERDFSDRILPISHEIAEIWGQLNGLRPMSCIDSLLAATCLVHRLVLVTRNVEDIADTGVDYLNPFE